MSLAGRDVGAVAAVLDGDAAEARMLADRLAGIGAEAAAARTLGDLLGDQRHRAIEADVEYFVAGFQARISLFVTHERPEAADAGRDRLAGLGVFSDFARQRQQF